MQPEPKAEPTSLTIADRWIGRVFDKAPMGVMQFDRDWNLIYANAEAMTICGLDKLETKSLEELFPDKDVRETVRAQMEKRAQGFSDEYEVEIIQAGTGNRVPVGVSGMPVVGLDGKTFEGSIAIMRNLELERARTSFDQLIEDACGSVEVLQIVAKECSKAIKFDGLVASAFSRDMSHSSLLIQHPNFLPVTRRWFPISESTRKWSHEKKPSRWDLLEIQRQIQAPELDDLIRRGFCWMLRFPVESEARLVGAISLFKKGTEGFSDKEFRLFRNLPLARAFLVGLLFRERGELEFRLELIKKISGVKTDQELFDVFVGEIQTHYGWSHISIFTVDEIERRIVLQSQAGGEELPTGYKQTAEQGLLGHVLRTGKDINCTNVHTDPVFQSVVHYSDNRPNLVSELCMGIMSGGKPYALLNIEDSRENAFSEDERILLRTVLDDIGGIIDRRRRDNLAQALVHSTPTAVFVVDGNGIIRSANPSAAALLGRNVTELSGEPIKQFIANSTAGEMLATSKDPGGEIEVLGGSGQKIRMHVGGSVLEEQGNLRMIVFRDMSLASKTELLENAARMLSAIARRVNTPLSIAGLCLEELRSKFYSKPPSLIPALFRQSRSPTETVPDVLGNIERQLHDIQLTYNEVQLYGSDGWKGYFRPVKINLQHFVMDALGDFPESDVKRLQCAFDDNLPDVPADPFQLSFIIRTLVAYFLQTGHTNSVVRIEVKAAMDQAEIAVRGECSDTPETYRSRKDLERARLFNNLSLSLPTIEAFIRNHHGKLEDAAIDDKGEISFRFMIPTEKHPASTSL